MKKRHACFDNAKRWLCCATVLMLGLSAAGSYAQEGNLNSNLLAPPPGGNLSQPIGNPTLLLQQRFGFSAQEAQQIAADSSRGSLSPQDLESLCDRITANHISPEQIQSAGQTMGLSPDVVSELMTCPAQPSEVNTPPAVLMSGGVEQQELNQKWHAPKMQPKTARATSGIVKPPASQIEQSFRDVGARKLLPDPAPQRLSQYGYALFKSPVSTFAPVDNVPVGGDYVIGIGDELRIMTWGAINQNLSEKVNRDGSIGLPQIGPVFVAGLNFDQAKQLIEGRFGQISNAHAQVTMGRLRTMQVYVLGNVAQPGVYTVSSLSRVSNVLAAAGGVTKVGSLRRVELRRNGATIRVIDLYRMLMSGDLSSDERLQPADVVFVPVIGPVVAVSGDVKVPAIYELARPYGESLGAVIQLSGGLSAFSSGERISVARVQDHSQAVAIDVRADEAGWRSFPIKDGDLVTVFPIINDQRNIVTLAGNVYRTGQFAWQPGMRASDLLRQGEGVKHDSFLGYALIKREVGPDRKTEVVAVDLGKILQPSFYPDSDVALQPLDTLTILRRSQIQQRPLVKILGEVNKPGSYRLYDNMRVSDLIYRAGGFRDDADRSTIELVRTSIVDGNRAVQTHQTITVSANGAASFGPLLQRNDEVFIQQASNWHSPWVVQVKGRVLRPGFYSVQPGEQLRDLLLRAGGFLPDAFPPGIVFTRASVRKLEQDRLETARAQLEQGIAQTALAQNAIAQSNGNAGGGTTASLAVLKDVLISSQSLQASGRVVVHVKSLQALETDPVDNVTLENGDTIAVPSRPSSVAVLGQVNEPTSIITKPGLRVRDYVASAGGTTQFADLDNLLLVRPDGAVVTKKGLSQSSPDRYFPLIAVVNGGIMNEPVEAGSTIYVPARFDTLENLEYTKSITTIVSQSVTSLAIIGILASSL
jgi:protein involved in polysaccharide export with SLBB domain